MAQRPLGGAAISVAAELGVADELSAGPKTQEDIARAVGAHAPSLGRLLRALSSVGIFAEGEDRRFANTPLSKVLESGNGSLRALALFFGDRAITLAWADMIHSVKTGESAFEKAHGASLFDTFARDTEFARMFSNAMTARSASEADVVHALLDVSGVETIVDIGGGHGALLARVLEANASQSGVLFDRPEVVVGALPVLALARVSSRCKVVAGDFFRAVPVGDGYLVKHILHDWDDESCLRILRNIHAAARPGARLFVLESVIPTNGGPHAGKLLDLQMLVVTHGGRERTRAEWDALLREGGFLPTRIVDGDGTVSLIEGTRA